MESLSFGRQYIVPKQFDPRALVRMAPAVVKAAMDTGVARVQVDIDEYALSLEGKFGRGFQVMNRLMEKAKSAPKRVVFAEGEEPKILRAAAQLAEQGIANVFLLGRPDVITARAASLGLRYSPRVIDPTQSDKVGAFRRGPVREDPPAQGHDPDASPGTHDHAELLRLDDGRTGRSGRLPVGLDLRLRIRYGVLEVVGVRDGVNRACGAYILLAQEIPGSSIRAQPYFLTDATVNIDPSPEDLAESAILVADLARSFDVDPRIAMLSFSNFGSVRHPQADKMRRAADIVRKRRPDLPVDGEMQADTAVVAEIVTQRYPFSQVSEAKRAGVPEPRVREHHVQVARTHRRGRGHRTGSCSAWASRSTSSSPATRSRRSSGWRRWPSWMPNPARRSESSHSLHRRKNAP